MRVHRFWLQSYNALIQLIEFEMKNGAAFVVVGHVPLAIGNVDGVAFPDDRIRQAKASHDRIDTQHFAILHPNAHQPRLVVFIILVLIFGIIQVSIWSKRQVHRRCMFRIRVSG